MTHPLHVATRARRAVGLSFLQAASDTTDVTTYTFSSQNLGTAASDRHIIVAVAARALGATACTISSVTVGGVAATISHQVSNNTTNSNVVGLAIAAVPSGTTGDIVVTLSRSALRCRIAAYRATTINPTATDTGTDTTAASSQVSDTIDVPAGGCAVAVTMVAIVTPPTTWTWGGVTEDHDATVETSASVSGASSAFAASQSGLSVTATYIGTNIEPALAIAAWGP